MSSAYELRYIAAKAPGGLIPQDKYKILHGKFLDDVRDVIINRTKIGICFISSNVDDLFFTYEVCSEIALKFSFHHMYATSAVDGLDSLKHRDDLNTLSPLVISGFGMEVNSFREKNAIEACIYERFLSRALTIVTVNVDEGLVKGKYQSMISQILFQKYLVIR